MEIQEIDYMKEVNYMNIQLKNENRAGLLYALDSNEINIPADKAIKGERYRCPVCYCDMHVCKTQSGKYIFARNPGKLHTDGKCISYESKSIKHTFDKLKPDEFITNLCRASSRKNIGKPRSTNGNSHESPDSNEDIKTSSFSSLKQIAEELCFLDGSTTHGNHKLSDFVVTYTSAQQVFKTKNYDLGARIIFCRYKSYDFDKKALLFDMFSKNFNFTVRFRLQFPNNNNNINFDTILNKCLEKSVAQNGTNQMQNKKAQDVYIAFDEWCFISHPDCSKLCRRTDCSKCYGMYQAVFTNSKQIYFK